MTRSAKRLKGKQATSEKVRLKFARATLEFLNLKIVLLVGRSIAGAVERVAQVKGTVFRFIDLFLLKRMFFRGAACKSQDGGVSKWH